MLVAYEGGYVLLVHKNMYTRYGTAVWGGGDYVNGIWRSEYVDGVCRGCWSVNFTGL